MQDDSPSQPDVCLTKKTSVPAGSSLFEEIKRPLRRAGLSRLTPFAAGLFLPLLTPLALCAQEAKALQGTGYFPAYIVGVLLVGLGVYIAIMPTQRLDEEKAGPQIRIAKGVKGEDFHKKH